jgi:hypothetical protein
MPEFKYGRMFNSEAFNPTDKQLDKLALLMTDSEVFFGHLTDTKSVEESISTSNLIPAGYVYLAQFLDHDISFDSRSDRFRHEDHPWQSPDITKVFNKRRPFFDLETIYGFDNPTNEKEYTRAELMKAGSKTLLNLGMTTPEYLDPISSGARGEYPNDLPRQEKSPLAKVVDLRNDSNLALAQTQVAFMKFHNAVIKQLNDSDSSEVFEKARKIAIRHYQYIILTDFLPKIVKNEILTEVIAEIVKNGQGKYYHPAADNIFIPIEFSIAAFRMGHSMIRNEYHWNIKRKAHISDLLYHTGIGGTENNGINKKSKNKLRSAWIINWNWFYDFNPSGEKEKNFNFAEPIDTKFSTGLNNLIPHHSSGHGRANSLSALDLYRGRLWKLPAGQDIAKEIADKTGEEILSSDDIESTFGEKLTQEYRDFFKKETQFLYDLLAEAEVQNKRFNTTTLGNVGSRIVAEVIVKLLFESPYSILKKDLESDEIFLGKETNGKFGMTEMLTFIAKMNQGFFDEINPITDSGQI